MPRRKILKAQLERSTPPDPRVAGQRQRGVIQVDDLLVATPRVELLELDGRAVLTGQRQHRRVARRDRLHLGVGEFLAADILGPKATLVPVGEDQVQHLELSREIARRWNARFAGGDGPAGYFPEPQPLLTPTRRIMGLDGQSKMSKSLGNTIDLLDEPDEVWAKLRPAMTDPARQRRENPGTPEICNIYHLHKAFSSPELVETVAVNCRTAGWGCLDCKRALHESMEKELPAIRARAKKIQASPKIVSAALSRGAEHARSIAQTTMREVKQRMGLA